MLDLFKNKKKISTEIKEKKQKEIFEYEDDYYDLEEKRKKERFGYYRYYKDIR